MALTEEIRIEIKAKADQAQKELKETTSALGGLQKAVLAAFTGAAVVAGVKKFVNLLQDAAEGCRRGRTCNQAARCRSRGYRAEYFRRTRGLDRLCRRNATVNR